MSTIPEVSPQPRERSSQWLTLGLFLVSSTWLAIGRGYIPQLVWTLADVEEYVRLAQGHTDQVMQPFASRQLEALVIRGLSHLTGASVYAVFVWVGAVSLVLSLALIGRMLLRKGAPVWVLVAIAASPFWSELFRGLALPDLWYTGLLCVMLYALERKQFLVGCLMLFPLMLSRESTLMVLVCLLLAGWKAFSLSQRLAAIAGTFAGSLIVKVLTAHALANQHNLPAIVYMIGKMPWNFTKNILGFMPWAQTLNVCKPIWRVDSSLLPIHSFGVCKSDLTSLGPMVTLFHALTRFGLFPLIFVFFFRPKTWRKLWKGNVFLRFCLLYGGLSFLLAPLLGASLSRLFGYAWPLFFLALPIALPRRWKLDANLIGLLLLHLIISYMPEVTGSTVSAFCVLLLASLLGWVLLHRLTSSDSEAKHGDAVTAATA